MNTYFILAPREMSDARIRQLLKKYLARGRVIFGIADEEYVAGFENQPQFKTLRSAAVEPFVAKSAGRLELIKYPQKASVEIIKKTNFNRALIINGSFHRAFHLRPEYQAILDRGATIKYLSPFTDESEAQQFANNFARATRAASAVSATSAISDSALRALIAAESARSFATDFQNAAAIVKNGKLIATAHNATVPYETYAMHFGSSREKHRTPAGDSSHYDTIHAETAALIDAGIDNTRGATIYMRTFPCPHCTRNIIYAGISEVVYELDYGDKYGYNLFDQAGIKYRRFKK